MALDDEIRQINNQQEFVELCNSIFAEKYQHDFMIVDGTRTDGGNDGYVRSEKRLFAIYCPVKPQIKIDADYQRKIHQDLDKAKKLHELGAQFFL